MPSTLILHYAGDPLQYTIQATSAVTPTPSPRLKSPDRTPERAKRGCRQPVMVLRRNKPLLDATCFVCS